MVVENVSSHIAQSQYLQQLSALKENGPLSARGLLAFSPGAAHNFFYSPPPRARLMRDIKY